MNLPLDPPIKEELLSLHRSSRDRKFCDRIKMILLLDKGFTYREVADILLVDDNTVMEWRKRFLNAAAIASFTETHYYKPFGQLTSKDMEFLDEYIRNSYITKASQLIDFIKKEFNVTYSPSGVRKILAKLGFTFKQLNLFPGNSDQQAQESFVDDYYKREANLTDNEAVMFLDAAHPIHNSSPAKTWSLKGVKDFILSNTGRHRVNINGAYDPKTQKVIVTTPRIVNSETTIELLEKIKEAYPEKSKIYLYADNAMYYRSRVMVNYLAENPLFQMVHLPPYSPNLNLIERLWKFMRREILNAVYYPTASEFEGVIKKFYAEIDQKKMALESFIGNKFQILSWRPRTWVRWV